MLRDLNVRHVCDHSNKYQHLASGDLAGKIRVLDVMGNLHDIALQRRPNKRA